MAVTSDFSVEELFIRPFEWDDQEKVVRLWHECGLVVPQNDPLKDIRLKADFQPDLFLVGLVHHEVEASIMAGYDGHRGSINYLAVSPPLQGKGVGRRMMAGAESLLKKLGCPKINLNVRFTNEKVFGFYQALGYAVDEVHCLGKRFK